MKKKQQHTIKLFTSLSLIIWALLSHTVSAEEWTQQYIDSVSFGGAFEGNSKDIYFGFTRYKQDGIGIGAEASVYRYDQDMNTYDYSSTYTERDLSITLPIAATDKVYITPAVGVRQIKNENNVKGIKSETTQYEPLYGLDLTYMLDNVSVTVGADKSKSSDWSITYGLGVSF
ncbi:hypothetical protein L4C31_17650 [Aliivibrio sifiae]